MDEHRGNDQPKRRQKVQVWIFSRKNRASIRFLILKTNAKRGGFWQPVTGSVEAGESLDSAALREAIEETSLPFVARPISLEHSFQFQSSHDPKGPRRDFEEWGYLLAAPANTPEVTLDPGEHAEYSWVSAEEARQRTKFASNREMLELAIRKLQEQDLQG